ncbi:MAG: type IV pilin protein [Gammaproteobacteria bacterium]
MSLESSRWRGTAHGHCRGFTLIELMIAVAIVAILAMVAYPAYVGKVRETRRSDGEAMLMQIMQAEQRNFTVVTPPAYTTDLSSLDYQLNASGGVSSSKGWYSIKAAACAGATIASCVILSAVPQGDQTNDTACGTLTLDSKGVKSSSGGNANCW